MQPDFIPRAPSGPGGDSFRRPSFASVLAARTTKDNNQITMAAKPSLPRAAPTATGVFGTKEGGASSASAFPTPLSVDELHENERQQCRAFASDRLWRSFCVLALDSPSTSELKSVFAHTCSDAFGGDGPVSSAMGGAPSNTMLFSGEVWTAVDALGGFVAEFLVRVQRRLRDLGVGAHIGGNSFGPTSRRSFGGNSKDNDMAEAAIPRLDYFSLIRILRPLLLGKTGGVTTPAAVLRLGCHEVSGCWD